MSKDFLMYVFRIIKISLYQLWVRSLLDKEGPCKKTRDTKLKFVLISNKVDHVLEEFNVILLTEKEN